MIPTYPTDRQHCGYFARFAKALFRSDAIERVGIDAVTLSLFVAAKEDALHYRRAPTIWRDEITERLQLRSPKRVIAARTAAVNAGLLCYSKHHRRATPIYWVLVPDWLSPFFHVPKRNISQGSRSETEHLAEHGAEHETEHLPKDPVPITYKSARTPSKSPKTFQQPTLEEVQAYAASAGLAIDAAAYCDHYRANGWRIGGRAPMRDWQAAVRQWARRQRDYQGVTPSANGYATTGTQRRKI